MALYRKYRPATFAEVVGQEHVTEPLSTALSAGRINHAYLFSGPRGCGKTSSARILARSLNCEQGPTPAPCGVCDSCVALAPNGGGSVDVVELDGHAEDARNLLQPARADAVRALLVLLHLLKGEAQRVAQALLAHPDEHPAHADPAANMLVDWVG